MPAIIKIVPDDITVLVAAEADLQGGQRIKKANYMRHYAENWIRQQDAFYWTVDAPFDGEYEVIALMNGEGDIRVEGSQGIHKQASSGEARMEESASLFDGAADLFNISVGWERKRLTAIQLKAGLNTVKLYRHDQPAMPMLLFSLELIQSQVKARLQLEAEAMRSDTAWLGQSGYGMMFQWTNRSQPRRGPKKAWPQVVDDFDVDAFVSMILETGASYVIWTSSWGPQYIPAPIRAVEQVLPGRTSQRDLMGEMMDALGEHGIKLMLYYHAGYDCYHSIDREWFGAMGGYKMDKTEFFINYCAILSEMGERYGTRLAGWFIDGAHRLYDPHYDDTPHAGPGQAPWKKMAQAAKSGNSERIISYNSWIKPRLTDFQDFYCGEGYRPNHSVPVGGNGIFSHGPYEGLQAHTCFPLEKTWGHIEPNSDIAPPRYTAEQLIDMVKDGISRRNPLSINMEMYEDGSVSPASLEMMRRVRANIRGT